TLAEERFKALSAEQSAVIESLDLEAAELAREADLSVFFADGEALAEAWAESTLTDRRMLLGCVLKSLTIAPARFPGDRAPILDSVVPQWVALWSRLRRSRVRIPKANEGPGQVGSTLPEVSQRCWWNLLVGAGLWLGHRHGYSVQSPHFHGGHHQVAALQAAQHHVNSSIVSRSGSTIPQKELIARLLADTCEICGSKGNVQVHHVRALADLAHAGRQPSDWTRVMLQRRRKTVVACDVRHDRIHSEQPARTFTP
ncbi:hypothetical protein AB0M39_25390, partial [Streptomyces sp. NPDC051907]